VSIAASSGTSSGSTTTTRLRGHVDLAVGIAVGRQRRAGAEEPEVPRPALAEHDRLVGPGPAGGERGEEGERGGEDATVHGRSKSP
jgi:hypothetical protein